MTDEKNNDMQIQQDGKEYIYTFEVQEEMGSEKCSRFRRRMWQILPSVCASFMCIPYGLMLGWPSPAYPVLVSSESPIPISLDQSAMIAGFLMIGNSLSTPFSSSTTFGAKNGIVAGATIMTVSWIIMWLASDIYWLLVSRILTGLGNGYGIGQLKIYISEICHQDLSDTLTKLINMYIIFGVVLAFAIGPFLSIRLFAMACVIITIFVLFLTIFLPSTPKELLKKDKIIDAKRLLQFLDPQLNADSELANLRKQLSTPTNNLSLFHILKDKDLRPKIIIIFILVVFVQFVGAPATIIYSQMLFKELHCPYPEFCALSYSFVFFCANLYFITCCSSYDKKKMLIYSNLMVSLLFVIEAIVIVYKVNEKAWKFLSLTVMILFIIAYTLGLGCVPFSLVGEIFPSEAVTVVAQVSVITHCISGLLITKTFQVLLGQYGVISAFCLFLAISLAALVFIVIFVPSGKNK